ncbi:MAG: sugar phosphate isomerase/epimerase [Clostridia bacterium]|nr:sugar phosphate isomerase/epimerase [Clostridia bacterium]
MKLGIIVRPEADAIRHAKELGLDFVEMDLNYPKWFGKPMAEIQPLLPELKAAFEETGMECGSVGRWASQIIADDGSMIEEEWNEVKAVIDFGAELGATHYLCSVGYNDNLTYYGNITAAIKALREIVAYAKEKGMTTSIVNCIMGNNYIRTPEQWKLVLDEVPGLTIKYDPSHSFVHGGDKGAYLREAMQWGDRFGYCHIKGVIQLGDSREVYHWKDMDIARELPEYGPYAMANRDADGNLYDNPPAGIDSINWRAFFAALYQHHYDGYLSIEPHSPTWQGELGEKGVKYTIKYIRDLML